MGERKVLRDPMTGRLVIGRNVMVWGLHSKTPWFSRKKDLYQAWMPLNIATNKNGRFVTASL